MAQPPKSPLLQPPGADNFHGTFGQLETPVNHDWEVSRINAEHSASKARSQHSKTSLSNYYPSNRRSKSMWREGVEFSNPSPARFQLPYLPAVGDLNPGMRDLEVWPSGAKSSVARRVDSKPGVSKQSKPKMLLELESYVAQQLFLIEDRDPTQYHPEVFQVYQNVFQFFIEKMHTYAPLLSAVKYEFELVLEDYMRRIQNVSGIQENLDEVDAYGVEQVRQLELSHQQEIDALKVQSQAKEQDIIRLQAEENVLNEAIQEVEMRITQTEERRKAVHQSNVALCGSLQFYEDWLQTFTRPENYEMMLKESQAEFTRVLEELQLLKKATADRVPREDLDADLEAARVLREELKVREQDVTQLKNLIDKTNKTCEQLQLDVDKLEAQVTGLTPRPDWEGSCAEYHSEETPLIGRPTGENVLALAKMVKSLNQELEEIRDSMPDELQSDDEEEEADEEWVHYEYFEGKGFGEDVPKYLQWEGRIKNRELKKRDTEMLIKQFWREKDKADAKRPKRMHVAEWMHVFLNNKYNKPVLIVDWGYNLVDAALKFKYDADCEMFYRVMTGELDETVYWEEFETMTGLMQLLQKLDMADNGGKVTGKLSKLTLLKALRKWFPNKSDVRFNKLKRCLAKEDAAKGNTVHYVHLFAEDKDYNQGPFAEMIRDQHVDEREEYIQDLTDALEEIGGGSEGSVNIKQAADAISQMDPKKPQKARDAYVNRGFGVAKNAKVGLDTTVLICDFVAKLARGVVKTSSKRSEIELESRPGTAAKGEGK